MSSPPKEDAREVEDPLRSSTSSRRKGANKDKDKDGVELESGRKSKESKRSQPREKAPDATSTITASLLGAPSTPKSDIYAAVTPPTNNPRQRTDTTISVSQISQYAAYEELASRFATAKFYALPELVQTFSHMNARKASTASLCLIYLIISLVIAVWLQLGFFFFLGDLQFGSLTGPIPTTSVGWIAVEILALLIGLVLVPTCVSPLGFGLVWSLLSWVREVEKGFRRGRVIHAFTLRGITSRAIGIVSIVEYLLLLLIAGSFHVLPSLVKSTSPLIYLYVYAGYLPYLVIPFLLDAFLVFFKPLLVDLSLYAVDQEIKPAFDEDEPYTTTTIVKRTGAPNILQALRLNRLLVISNLGQVLLMLIISYIPLAILLGITYLLIVYTFRTLFVILAIPSFAMFLTIRNMWRVFAYCSVADPLLPPTLAPPL